MGNSSMLSRLPVLRLLVPLIIGILAFRVSHSLLFPAIFVSLAIVVLIVVAYSKKTAYNALRLKSIHIVPLTLFMVAVGWFAAYVSSPPEVDVDKLRGQVCAARVETVDFNEKSMVMQVKLLTAQDDLGEKASLRDVHISLSTRGCDYDMSPGDVIVFALDLKRVRNQGNPDEMDYASYLYNKGVIYRQHLDLDKIVRTGSSHTLITRANGLRQDLEHKILNSQLHPSTQNMMIAVLLGNDDFIDPATRENYSVVGVAHVLALSGLHVAIIALLLWFFLFPLDYLHAKKLRLVFTLLLLIGYDIVTGLSPSVVRSTVMVAFVFMSTLFYRKSTPLNSLAAAALLILVFSPGSLYSVGFQLSFITVSALIIFYQAFEIKYPSNKLLKYFYSLFLTTVVAMISSTILTAYYFNTLSVMTVISNFIILPIFPVFMIVGAVVLLLLAMGGSLGWLNGILDWMTSFINGSVNWLSTWSFGHSEVYVTWVAVIIYYAVLIMLFLWISRRNFRWLLVAGVLVIIGVAHSIIVDASIPRKGMVVFNSYNSTPVLYYSHGNALLWVPDVENDFDIESFKRYHKAFLAHYNIDSLKLVDSTMCVLDDGMVNHPYASMCSKEIMSVGKGHWKKYEPGVSGAVKFDVLLVTKQYHSTIAKARELFNVRSVILSGDIYDDNVPALEKECQQLGVPYYSIKSRGAYVVRSD